MVERVQQHLAIAAGTATFYVIFPDPPLLVQTPSGYKQFVLIDKILIHKGVDKHKVIIIIPQLKQEIFSLSGLGIELFAYFGV